MILMNFKGNHWIFMNFKGNQWILMNLNGNHWILMNFNDFNEFQRKSFDFYEFQWKSFDFESVWRPSSDTISGHSFKLTAGVTGGLVKPYDWVLDFSEIKLQIKPLIDKVDHQDLSNILEARGNSCEGLLDWFSEKSSSQNKYDFCLQFLPTRGAYGIESISQLSGAIPYLDWRMR